MGAIYEKKDMVACLTINRPEFMNTIDQPTFRDMQAAVADFRDDPNLPCPHRNRRGRQGLQHRG